MGDERTIIRTRLATSLALALVFSTFLILTSLAWLAVVLVPALRQQLGLGTALAISGTMFFVVGLSQVLTGLKTDAGRNRRLILLNGGFALAVPLSALAHNAIAVVSGGVIEEPIFLIATVLLPPAVIVTSFLLCTRSFLDWSASRGQSRSRGGKARGGKGPRRRLEKRRT